MQTIKQPIHFAYFSHLLREINWANAAAVAIMVLYLLAMIYADNLQDIVNAINGVPW